MDQVNHLIKQKFYALNFTFSHFLRQKLNGHVQPLPREAGRGASQGGARAGGGWGLAISVSIWNGCHSDIQIILGPIQIVFF